MGWGLRNRGVKIWMKAVAPLLLFLLSGCGEGKADPVAPDTYFDITIGEVPIRVQLALTEDEILRGLMFRESMAEHDGMLFIFRNEGRRSFYMRNTFIPLDVGYITRDGVLREIYPMYPRDERGVPSRRDDIQLVLEMNQGWFQANGVKPGARLDLEAVSSAMEARGVAVSGYRLGE